MLSGETSLEGAIREVNEELGIDVSSARHIFIKTERRDQYHDMVDSWLFIIPREGINITIDSDEVADYAWASYKK